MNRNKEIEQFKAGVRKEAESFYNRLIELVKGGHLSLEVSAYENDHYINHPNLEKRDAEIALSFFDENKEILIQRFIKEKVREKLDEIKKEEAENLAEKQELENFRKGLEEIK